MRRLALLLLLWPTLALSAPQPYMPRPEDLADKDKPGASVVRQVRNRSDIYRGGEVPAARGLRPPSGSNRPDGARFQPQPYVPRAGDLPAAGGTPAQTAASPTPPAAARVTLPGNGTEAKPELAAPNLAPPGNEAENKALVASVINKVLTAYQAKDCQGMLKLFHSQAYVLVRNPWGEQGSLGHQQLREAYCANLSGPQAPPLQLKANKVEIVAPGRAKTWGQLTAKIQHQGQPVDMPASFETDMVQENGAWLITDAIIQYDAP